MWFSVGATIAAATIVLLGPATSPPVTAVEAAPIVQTDFATLAIIAPIITKFDALLVTHSASPTLAVRPDAPAFTYSIQKLPQIDTPPAPLHGVHITVVDGNDARSDKKLEVLVAAGGIGRKTRTEAFHNAIGCSLLPPAG